MRKAKLLVSSLCIVAVLALSMPAAVYADEGPQGGVKSTKDAPPPPPTPPPSGAGGVLGEIIALLLS